MGRSGFPIAALGAALGAAAAFWLWKESQPTSPEPAIKPMHKPAPLVDEEKDQVSGQSEAEVPQQPEKTISRLTRNFSVSPDAIISGFESLFEGIAHSSQEHRLFKTIEDVAAPAPAAAAVSLSSTNDEESAQVEKAKSLIEDEFSRIISTLESEFERKLSAALQEQQQQLQEKHIAEIDQAVAVAFQAEREDLINRFKKQHEEEKALWKKRQEDALQKLELDLLRKFGDEKLERKSKLDSIERNMVMVEKILDLDSKFQAGNRKIQQLSASLICLEKVLVETTPFDKPWDSLEKAGSEDPVIQAAIQTVPKEVRTTGVASIDFLKQKFNDVEIAAREAALVHPEDGLFGVLLASLFSKLLVSERRLTTENDDLAKISRAGHFVECENLLAAVVELEQLSPIPKQVCSTWLEIAKNRLLVEQALNLVKAELISITTKLPDPTDQQ